MRTRKLLEVLAFLVTLGAAYALWFVPMNIVQELLTLAVGLGVQCGTSVGGEEASLQSGSAAWNGSCSW